MIEQAIFLARRDRLRQGCVILPIAEVWRRRQRSLRGAFLSDEKAAGDGKQIGMLPIAWIEGIDCAIDDREFPQQNIGPLRIIGIRQQPGVIGFASRRSRDALQVDLKLVVDPLCRILIHLTAAHEIRLPNSWNRRCGRASMVICEQNEHADARSYQRDEDYSRHRQPPAMWPSERPLPRRPWRLGWLRWSGWRW